MPELKNAMATKFDVVDWAKNANVYEVNLRQYTTEGTINAFATHLQRLQKLGVKILWFMPVTPISKVKRLGTLGSYYACSDYCSINPEFGTLEDFNQLVALAHEMGLKILIDWVANHTGWNHTWTVSNPNFYKKDSDGNFFDSNGWEDVIDLDYSNPALRIAMIAAMRFWVEKCNIDGFRCDMAHLVPLDFWKEARTQLDTQKKLFWLAETEEPVYHDVFDATYAWELLHTMEAIYKRSEPIAKLDEVFAKYTNTFPGEAMRLLFITNHDENSHSGSEFERLGDSAKAFAVLCATWKNGLPLIYSGQELPNTKRLKFFDKDEIDWKPELKLEQFYSTLLHLHHTNPTLAAGDETVKLSRLETSANDSVFAYQLQKDGSQLLVLLNLSSNGQLKFTVDSTEIYGAYTSAFSGVKNNFLGELFFEMQAWEYLVYYK